MLLYSPEKQVAAAAEPTIAADLRVLHVGKFYPPYLGGMETHLQSLCENLSRSVAVQVLVANEDRRSVTEVVQGVEVTRLGTWLNVAAAPLCPGLVGAMRRAQADLVHLHLPNPAAVMAYLASGQRGRLVVTWHSDVIRQKLLSRAFAPILHRLLNRCDAVIATSPPYLDGSPELSAYRDRCCVIPFGIPLDEFRRRDAEAAMRIRARYGSRLIMSVGRMVYYKGFEYLIRAMQRIDGCLLLVGDGPLRLQLEAEAWRCGVRDRVVFLGKLSQAEMIDHYHAADVFALPSIARSEAFGIVQLEAMACGKPVINTQLDSGVPFVSRDRETGLTVPPADAEALAGAINLLLDDAALRAAYGKAALRRVQNEFELQVMVRRMLELYAQVMAGV